MGNLLLLIPGLFSLIEKFIGPMDKAGKGSILTTVLGSNGSVDSIMDAIKGAVGEMDKAREDELKAEVSMLVSQADLNKQNSQSEHAFVRDWRPALAWGLVILVLVHLGTAEFYNLYCMFKGYALAPLDTLTVTLMFGILGLHISTRTLEKVTGRK